MENISNSNRLQILERIEMHFDFLFRRGFRVTSALFVGARDEQWQIRLTAGHYLIQLQGHEERVSLALNNLELWDEASFLGLHELISLIEQQGNSSLLFDTPLLQGSDDFTTIAGLLEEHVDKILVLMDTIHHKGSFDKARASDLNTCPGF